MSAWRRFDHQEMHRWLIERCKSDVAKERWVTADREIGAQAVHCPYYVPLEGTLGADWGVIVNPESSRFALLTFEHDDCGCPTAAGEDADGWGRHAGTPSQEGDMWCSDWHHVCDEWCDDPCDARTAYRPTEVAS